MGITGEGAEDEGTRSPAAGETPEVRLVGRCLTSMSKTKLCEDRGSPPLDDGPACACAEALPFLSPLPPAAPFPLLFCCPLDSNTPIRLESSPSSS